MPWNLILHIIISKVTLVESLDFALLVPYVSHSSIDWKVRSRGNIKSLINGTGIGQECVKWLLRSSVRDFAAKIDWHNFVLCISIVFILWLYPSVCGKGSQRQLVDESAASNFGLSVMSWLVNIGGINLSLLCCDLSHALFRVFEQCRVSSCPMVLQDWQCLQICIVHIASMCMSTIMCTWSVNVCLRMV